MSEFDVLRAQLAEASRIEDIRRIVGNASVTLPGPIDGSPQVTLLYSGSFGEPPNDVPAYKVVDAIAETTNGHAPGTDGSRLLELCLRFTGGERMVFRYSPGLSQLLAA